MKFPAAKDVLSLFLLGIIDSSAAINASVDAAAVDPAVDDPDVADLFLFLVAFVGSSSPPVANNFFRRSKLQA